LTVFDRGITHERSQGSKCGTIHVGIPYAFVNGNGVEILTDRAKPSNFWDRVLKDSLVQIYFDHYKIREFPEYTSGMSTPAEILSDLLQYTSWNVSLITNYPDGITRVDDTLVVAGVTRQVRAVNILDPHTVKASSTGTDLQLVVTELDALLAPTESAKYTTANGRFQLIGTANAFLYNYGIGDETDAP